MIRDVVIIGAGAAGMMCAIIAGKRGRRVTLLDHNARAGEKILISGGGRCNFSNLEMSAEHFISSNSHFVKSALARFKPSDFISMIERHLIGWQKETDGRLFSSKSSRQIVDMLVHECKAAGAHFLLNTKVRSLEKRERFIIKTSICSIEAENIVVATGGLSYPKLGASDFGFCVAQKFGLSLIAPSPALVPLVFAPHDKKHFGKLAGISLRARVRCAAHSFCDDMLFTHRGLSGPAILQASSYWNDGQKLKIDLMPDIDIAEIIMQKHREGSCMELKNFLSHHMSKRLAESWCECFAPSRPLSRCSGKELAKIADRLHNWEIVPAKTEGYGKAEVTRGGVDTAELSSKTMESKKVPGIYFVGEVLDVAGELGGYNLHWAWASGHAAGEAV